MHCFHIDLFKHNGNIMSIKYPILPVPGNIQIKSASSRFNVPFVHFTPPSSFRGQNYRLFYLVLNFENNILSIINYRPTLTLRRHKLQEFKNLSEEL